LGRARGGLSELLSALILLGVSIAIAFILVHAIPVISPQRSRPWLKPVPVYDAIGIDGGRVRIYTVIIRTLSPLS